MKMKKLIFPLLVLTAVLFMASCENYETYGDKKAKEREAIDRYIAKENIKVISEAQFKAQGQTTNVADNEYVRLERSGVYMQIVRQGCGDMLEANKSVNILCRFDEYNILADSLLASNSETFWFYNATMSTWINGSDYVDKINVTRTGTTISASFIEGVMLMLHPSSSSVPAGWLVPLNYVSIGRPESENDEISLVRLIVPHSQGTADASSSVYPCAYEITYMREK